MNHKEKFLRAINEAFAASNSRFILEHVTDDIRWHIIGDKVVEGKEAFGKALKEMESDQPFYLSIHNIITHGSSATVDGILQGDHSGETKTYAFCDVYKFSGFKDPKIREMTSYVLEVKR